MHLHLPSHRFPAGRRDGLWLGVGVALAFTGGVEPDARRTLESSGGEPLQAGLARGTALVRALAGRVAPTDPGAVEASGPGE